MQSALLLDQDADISTLPEAYKSKITPSMRGDKIVWIFPRGTVFEGDHALQLVRNGQAGPIDEECAAACGMSMSQLAVKQREYLAASKGIKGKKDLELFMAGVIDGYEPGSTDDKPIYIKGENWQAWQDAKNAAKQEQAKEKI